LNQKLAAAINRRVAMEKEKTITAKRNDEHPGVF